MKSGVKTWSPALPLAALVLLLVACSGVELRRPLIAYDFDNPILNEQWLRAHHDPLPPARIPPPVAKVEAEPVAAEAVAEGPKASAPNAPVGGAAAPRAAAASPRGAAAKPLPVATAGEQVPREPPRVWEDSAPGPEVAVALPILPAGVVPADDPGDTTAAPVVATRPADPEPGLKPHPQNKAIDGAPAPEVADAAGRLVGIRSSFDQDSFLKHVLFVSNVALDDAPGEGLVRWVWKRYGTKGKAPRLSPGHLVFIGWGDKTRMVGVVESVSEHGTARFVTVHGDEVKRLTITPGKPGARRDERSGRILNSAVGKGRLAGECLLGSVAVVPDATGSAALATAE